MLIFLSIFVIYKVSYKGKLNYVVLGDSLSAGKNPYGEIGYGYSDFLANYLSKNKKLNSYISGYTNINYNIDNLIDDINNNKNIINNGKKINIRNTLRESNLITISIGFNDLSESIKKIVLERNFINKVEIKKDIDIYANEFSFLIKLVKKYAKNDIIVIGYYNPYPYFETYKQDINDIIQYSDFILNKVCEENNISFLKISDIFENYTKYFPNSLDIHPNVFGYEKIFLELKKKIDGIYAINM